MPALRTEKNTDNHKMRFAKAESDKISRKRPYKMQYENQKYEKYWNSKNELKRLQLARNK